MKKRSILLASILGGLLALVCLLGLAARPGVARAAAEPQTGAFITLTVQAGDNLSKYTFLYGVTGSQLVASNQFKDPNLIFPGQVIVVPVVKSFTPSLTTPFYYVVQAGDQLNVLAGGFEMDPGIIATDNNLQNNVLVAGSTLFIPAGPHRHFVAPGETLQSIAARYGAPVSLLSSGNPGVTNPNAIFSGQPIFIPIQYGAQPVPITGNPAPTAGPGTPTTTPVPGATATNTPAPTATVVGAGNLIQVTVRAGESLVTYVERYGVSGWRITAVNPLLLNPNLIFPGQVLNIPVAVSFTPSRTTPFFYGVQAGDTVDSIAAKFEMGPDTVAFANPGTAFAAGATVLIPAGPHLYTVKAGDTWTAIAGRYGTTGVALATANKAPDANTIFAGQLIFVPIQLDENPAGFN